MNKLHTLKVALQLRIWLQVNMLIVDDYVNYARSAQLC